MAMYEISIQARVLDVEGNPVEADSFARQLDDVIERLLELEAGDPDLYDGDVRATLANAEVELTINVQADNPLDAARKGGSTIRCAVHAAGGHTPGWDDAEDTGPGSWGMEYEGSSQRRLEPAVA